MASFAEAMPESPAPERIFNPSHLTWLGVKPVKLDGREVLIHETNNLLNVVQGVLDYEEGVLPTSDLSLVAYYATAAENPTLRKSVMRFVEEKSQPAYAIFSMIQLKKTANNTEQKIIDADVQAHVIPMSRYDKRTDAAMEYYKSLAYDRMSDIAKEIDPDFDTVSFVT